MTTSSSTPLDGRASRWAGHRERRRAEIVERAVEVIDREGADAPVESIARACGVTRQVLYRQFDGRHDLDTAVADRVVSMLLEHVIVRMTADDGIEAGIRGSLDAYLDFVLEHRPLYDFVRALPSAPGSGSPVDRITDVVVTVVAEIAAELLGPDAQQSLPLRDVYATGLVGLADAVVSRWLADPGARTRDELVESLVEVLGLCIEPVLGQVQVLSDPAPGSV
jgi:AcrR family transcriptional regulator